MNISISISVSALFTWLFYYFGESNWRDWLEIIGLNEDEKLWLFTPIFLIIFAIAYVMQRKEDKEKEEKENAELERELENNLANISAEEAIEFLEKRVAGGNLSSTQHSYYERYLERIVRKKKEEEEQRLKQLLLDDKEYQDAVEAGDKDAAKARKLELQQALEKEIEAEPLRKKGRECRDLGKPFCAWCMFPDHCMEFVEGEAGEYIWKYRNKDGSRDMRVVDNRQQAGFTSEWLCKECGAKTTVEHYIDESPSKNVKAWKVTLNSNGSGERIGEDWESDEGTTVDKTEAHRKGG